ncbi:fungal-specific transcription factor domain-containing protein [Fusarium sp. MPI-SDFR-AT-0072]|nr:fungal-specific transcription factor domain-containing protein [Fusarium sp. MPI-SDFR-AT-0072]
MSTSLRKRQKVSSACERCRKRKLGCDAERPCVHCIRAGAQCIPRNSASAESTALSAGQSDARNRHVQDPGSPILPESNIVDLSTLIIRGNGSNQDLRHDTSSLPGGTKLVDVNATPSGPKHWRNVAGVELPADQVLEQLVDSFFSSVNWFMMVFHEYAFRHRYTEMLQQRQIKYQDTTFYWTWLLVVALGAHYAALKDPDDQMSPQYRQLSQDLIAVIETKFLQIVGCQTVETVQICILLGSFIFYTRPTTGLGICGMGVKIAQVIGLHRESFWKEASQLAREVKRRTWWTLEVFDKYAAVAFGRPCIIDDSDCQVEMISDIDIDGQTHVPASPLILYHQQKFRLYRIMGAFLGRKRQSSRFESIETIHQRMIQWRHELPDVLTLSGQEQSMDPSVVKPTEIHALSLQLTYNNLQIILHRTAVFNNVNEISMSPKNSTSLQQIFTSAMDTSELSRHPRILDACRRTHADVHVGMTMFTAGVVLCAICLSQPLTEMGSRAKTGVMHITRMCRETTPGLYSGQLISEQSLGIIDSLVEVMLRQETDIITGRTSYSGLQAVPINRGTVSSHLGSSTASRIIAPRPSTSAVGPRESRNERVLDPIQEVFRQHISTPSTVSNIELQSTVTRNHETEGDQGTMGTFNWDGDMSSLVGSGLVDASQLWLWADTLDFDSFNDPAPEPAE